MVKIKIIVFFLAFNTFALAQNETTYYKQKYPNVNEVILKQINHTELRLEKDKLNIISKKNDESIVITDDVNKINTKGSVVFSDFTQIKELNASTEFLNKKYEVRNFRIVPDKNSRSFHDDTKIKEFDYSQLAMGAKKKLSYTTEYLEPRLLSGELFIENYPIEYKEYKVTVDKDIDLGFKVFNDHNQSISFTKEEKGNKVIYKWVSKDIPQYKYEEGMPSILYFVPMVEVYIKSYKNKNGERITLLSSLEDLHKLYQDYTKDIYETPSEELVKKAQELKALHEDELDQVKEIYYWVKDNVKYIAFEDGYGGFVPRKPNDVFSKRYGDCKDMAVVIYTMLRAVGIENVYLTWIGSREKPFKYQDIPTQIVDDHMIATYQYNGKNYFLDGTSKDTPFNYPTSFIQGKQGLLHKSKDSYEIVEVPIVPSQENVKSENITLAISNEKLTGNSKVSYTGFVRDNFLTYLKDLSGFQKTEFLKNSLQLGNNKFFLDRYEMAHVEDRDKELKIDYSFNIDNYVVKGENEMYVNMILEKLDELKTINAKRSVDFHFDNTYRFQQKITLKIPEGYKLGYRPQNSEYKGDDYNYTIQYQETPEGIMMNLVVNINIIELKKEKVEQWNEFVNQFKESTTASVSIIKR